MDPRPAQGATVRWLRRWWRRRGSNGTAAHDEAQRLAQQAQRTTRRVDRAVRTSEALTREIEAALALRREHE